MRTVEILIPETFEHLTPDQRAMLVRRIDAWHDRYERTERTEKALQELQFRASRKIDNLNDSNNQGG